MRILWINGNPNKNAGGTETHSIHFINALYKMKDIDLFVAVAKNSFVDRNIHIPASRKVYIKIDKELSPISTVKLVRFARQVQPDFVIGNNGNEYINTYLTAKFSGAKAVVFRHMTNKQPFFLKKFIFPNLTIFAVSDYVKEKLLKDGVKSSIKVIPNFLSKDFEFNEKKRKHLRKELNLDNKIVFLFVGKVDEGKGIFDFIDTIKSLQSENVEAFVVGYGKDFEKAQDLAKNVKNINFVGKVNNVIDYYLLSDVFLMPSHADESFGRTVIEAMATKNIIVAYKSGNIPYLVQDGINGFLAENKKELIVKSQYILDNIEKLNPIRENAYSFFKENFSESIVLDKFVKALKEIKK